MGWVLSVTTCLTRCETAERVLGNTGCPGLLHVALLLSGQGGCRGSEAASYLSSA